MTLKAVVFDIGQTLTYYPIPLNRSKLYRPSFKSVEEKLGLTFTDEDYIHFGEVTIQGSIPERKNTRLM